MSRLLPGHKDMQLPTVDPETDDPCLSVANPEGPRLQSGRSDRYNLRDHAEDLPVDLPSSRTYGDSFDPSSTETAAMEMEVRLTDVAMAVALSNLRRGLVDQAYIFRCDVRQSASSGNLKLGYDAAKKAREHARTAAASNRAHAATYRMLLMRSDHLQHNKLSRLGRTAWAVRCERFQPLTDKDIECNTATYDVKDHSGKLELPWFWKLDRRAGSDDDDEYIADCESAMLHQPAIFALMLRGEQTVFRIRWIEAKCAYMRCAEELVKLHQEMDMTYLGYHARADIWRRKAEHLLACGSTYSGHAAAAFQEQHSWRSLARRARTVFCGMSPSLPGLSPAEF